MCFIFPVRAILWYLPSITAEKEQQDHQKHQHHLQKLHICVCLERVGDSRRLLRVLQYIRWDIPHVGKLIPICPSAPQNIAPRIPKKLRLIGRGIDEDAENFTNWQLRLCTLQYLCIEHVCNFVRNLQLEVRYWWDEFWNEWDSIGLHSWDVSHWDTSQLCNSSQAQVVCWWFGL